MKKRTVSNFIALFVALLTYKGSQAQITVLQDYSNKYSAPIGTYQGIKFREAGFSGLFPIPNTNGREFWTISDRGVNIDCGNANLSGCRPTYDKMFPFPTYAPKIHRIRIVGDSIQILQTITMKRPNGTGATGLMNPTGYGSTAVEVISTDTVQNCLNFNAKTAAKDIWGIDSEGIIVDAEGNFWICEEGGPTIWKLNPNGVVIRRYTPYANMPGAQAEDFMIDSCFKYRKNNRGFENITIAPNGKIYALIQSPILYPNQSTGEGTRIHRMLEIDPITNQQRMFVYLNDGIIGASGSNQIRLRDWKLGDMAAINDSTFLVLEAAARGTSDYRRLYQININGATVVKSGFGYAGKTLEAAVDSLGLAAVGVKAVRKKLVMDLVPKGWPVAYDKAEGLAIINDSTIAICNDNDFGQTSVLQDGLATATSTVSHVVVFALKGNDKLKNFKPAKGGITPGITAISSSQSPYLTSVNNGTVITSILTAGDVVNGYKMAGIPDGTGAYDNGDGTFTLLVNHEIPSTGGVARAHGQKGAFVSKWIIKKSDLSVVSGSDLIKNVILWDTTAKAWVTYNTANPSAKAAFGRFCSADLPAPTAFYNAVTGLGTTELIFMNGEESGIEGRAFGHIVTGSNAGNSYELPNLGKASWENAVASPATGNKTTVALLDDGTDGQVYIYVGTKTNSGLEIEKAGLTNGKPFGIKVAGFSAERVNSSTLNPLPAAGTRFSMVDLGNVLNTTGAVFNTRSNDSGVTKFSRPEDGLWDPANPRDFYFLTTDQFDQTVSGVGSQIGRSRVWRLRFDDIANPEKGGTIEAVLDGTEGQVMLDNAGIDNSGHILLQEDVGNQKHNGKLWQYTIATDEFKLLAKHDVNRFGDVNVGAMAPYNQDEESSGIIDAQNILGPGMFLLVDQAHYSIAGEVYEGGQILAMFNPETFSSNPEIAVWGNNKEILNDDTTPSLADYTDFSAVSTTNVVLKTFVIKNNGPGILNISNINISGTNAGDFTIVGTPAFPIAVAANSVYSLVVKFAPTLAGNKKAILNIFSNDYSEFNYSFRIQGNAFISGPTGPSSSQSPYLVGVANGVTATSILTAGDVVNGYKMVGIPDGAGAFDNNNGTFTLLINHEIPNTGGVARAHGQKGAFVSKWIINKSNLSVISGADLIKNVVLWDTTTKTWITYNSANPSSKAAFGRFCSADLPAPSAFYNAATGLGTTERIFMNGEESGIEGRAFANIVTGSAAGNTYELPALGKASWENAVANPYANNKTMVALMDDGTDGQVYMYVGTKTNTGLDIDKAGLNNGKPYGIKVAGFSAERVNSTTLNTLPAAGTRFSMVDLGNVRNTTGAIFNTRSNDSGVTKFSRPEDGVWDPANPRDFYFLTTDQFDQTVSGVGSQIGRSRVWRLRFDDIANPEKGGTIEAVLDGTEGQVMLDNAGIDNSGHILLQEDVGNQQHNGKVWQYTIANDQLKQIAKHDPARFGDVGVPAATPFNQDEESSGIFDAQSILGPGMFLAVDQAHYSISGEVYEGGQILAVYNPETFNSQAEVSVTGASVNIADGDLTPDAADNTDFGPSGINLPVTKPFVIKNNGPGPLTLANVTIGGINAADFSLVSAPSFPVVLASNATQTINVKFSPKGSGNRVATLIIANNDLDEASFDFGIQGQGIAADIQVVGNGNDIADGDMTPGVANNTDFGIVNANTTLTKKFYIQNTSSAILNISNITIGGANASEFTLVSAPSYPLSVAAWGNLELNLQFKPTDAGKREALVQIYSNDPDEGTFDFKVAGNGNFATAVENISLANAVKVYPNPASDKAEIAVNLQVAQSLNIRVLDLNGKEVVTPVFVKQAGADFKTSINTSNLSNGIYLVEIATDKEVARVKLVVKK